MGKTDLLNIINGYPVTERILLVEAILKQIREEERSETAPE
jgi:ATP-dependent RNA circularization protein (DNA/RNA ligase family)